MTSIVATNITSPLGLSTEENYAAVRRGESGLKTMDGCLGVPGRFCLGIFSQEQKRSLHLEGFSWFESLVLHSVRDALSRCDVDPASPRTLLIVGTSTGGVEELGETPDKDGLFLAPPLAVKKVAQALGFVSEPLAVSNACISGATAQMLADRLIASGAYDSALVCGADALSAFVLAGFFSFKALSAAPCRPFDIERLGLNIGECAATMVLTRDDGSECWRLCDGCLNNDAYHVSAPIPSGDGVCRAIQKVLTPEVRESLACVTAHGTATMFNDQMESKGIGNAGLCDIPVTAYKAHFGHTFGASGVVEAIITMCSLDEGLVLPTLGFQEIGVSGKIQVCDTLLSTSTRAFIKTQSGFGSCNGALLYAKSVFSAQGSSHAPSSAQFAPVPAQYDLVKSLRITPDGLWLDGEAVPAQERGAALLSELFKARLADGSRFFKMDLFSRLAYLGAGLLAKDALEDCPAEDIALLFFTQNGSLLADRKHLSTFSAPDAFYPSPAVFINTLPNIVLGEIALSQQIKGETTLVMIPERDDSRIEAIAKATTDATRPAAMIYGWVDCTEETAFRAELKLIKIKK